MWNDVLVPLVVLVTFPVQLVVEANDMVPDDQRELFALYEIGFVEF